MFSDLINGTKDLAQTKHRFLQYYILMVDFPQEYTLFSLNFGATFHLFSGSQVLLFSHLSLMVLVLSLDLKNWKWFEIKSRKITDSEFYYPAQIFTSIYIITCILSIQFRWMQNILIYLTTKLPKAMKCIYFQLSYKVPSSYYSNWIKAKATVDKNKWIKYFFSNSLNIKLIIFRTSFCSCGC